MATHIAFVKNDGGRTAAGYRGDTGDCVVRAIAIATGKPYREVYEALHERTRSWLARPARGRRQRQARDRHGGSPRDGVPMDVLRQYLAEIGWTWTPTMHIGWGCGVHLRAVPAGRLIVRVSRHLAAVIDGVLHDTHDCSRDGTRCVYGYWRLR